MERAKIYIGTKIVSGRPMTKGAFLKNERELDVPGYEVIYEDGYRSWSPKETFERSYREVTPQEKALFASPR